MGMMSEDDDEDEDDDDEDEDDDDDDEGDEKSDGDSENEDTVQANMDEDMDQFRLPGLEECEKEGENYISFLNTEIKEVLVATLFFNPPSRHPATRPEDDSSKNKGQHRCPLQFLNKEGGREGERRVHVSAEEGSLHLLQLQPFPHRETYGLIPSFRGNNLFFFLP